jgi:WD repeat-containing protein 19
MGHIHYFFLEDWKLVTDFQHTTGIRELYADQTGSRLIVVDDRSEGYVYNPVSTGLLQKLPVICDGTRQYRVMA